MKKLLITCAAVMTACVAFAAGSMASTYDKTTNTVTVTADTSALAGQTAVLIIPDSDNTGLLPASIADSAILYIDQADKGSLNLSAMKVKGTELAAGNYIVAMACEDISKGIVYDNFTVGGGVTVLWGDVDTNGEVALGDMTAVVNYLLGTAGKYGNYTVGQAFVGTKLWGDVDTNGEVALGDMTAVVNYLLGTAGTYGGYTVGQNATIN